MLGNLNGWHLVIIVFVILLLFGAPKLPQLARSVGQSMKIFKSEVKSDSGDGADGTSATTTDKTSTATTDKASTDSSSDDTKPSS